MSVLSAVPATPFAQAFNRSSFMFDHDFHTHPLYDLGTLLDLARRIDPRSAYYSTRAAAAADGWEDQRGRDRSLVDAVAGIERSDTLVMLKDIEQDPVFGPVFQQALADMAARVGPALQDEMVHGRATLLISSPRRVTGYHIDAEANFLLQLRGSKTVYVFDGADRSLVPETELEAFYRGDPNAARYKPERQDDAEAYDFRPGRGIHVPIEAPHWVQNGDEMSVSISINYDLRSNEQRAKVFRLNSQLRRLGLSPAGPGQSAWLDAGKATLLDGMTRLRGRAGSV
ncbi:MAG: hypothetical protein WDN49_09925 [Acetobacteraceae bacterium]